MAAASVIRFDLRRAPFSTVSEAEQYSQCPEMCGWADEHGFIAATIPEHHGVDFVSSPVTLAGMILARAPHMFVSVNALLVTMHDPVRLACIRSRADGQINHVLFPSGEHARGQDRPE